MAGEWDVGKVARGLTAKQFMEWERYYELEPFGELRADYRAASIREMIHNVNVEGKHRRPVKDFLLKWDERPRKSWQEMKAVAMMWALTGES